MKPKPYIKGSGWNDPEKISYYSCFLHDHRKFVLAIVIKPNYKQNHEFETLLSQLWKVVKNNSNRKTIGFRDFMKNILSSRRFQLLWCNCARKGDMIIFFPFAAFLPMSNILHRHVFIENNTNTYMQYLGTKMK